MSGLLTFLKPKSRRILERGTYHNGIARVSCEDGTFNYVNQKGRILFKKGFREAEEFFDECAIADHCLINSKGEVLYEDAERLKGAENLFVIYHPSELHETTCALVNSNGKRLTGFEYTFFSVTEIGSIRAGYRRYERRSSVKDLDQYLWWCKLDFDGKEITPRLSYKQSRVNDSLLTCFIYNRDINCHCLYNRVENVIVARDVEFMSETKQFRKLSKPIKNAFEEPSLDQGAKYGVLDMDLGPVLPVVFDMIVPSTEPRPVVGYSRGERGPFADTDFYIVKSGDYYGLYSTSGKCLMEPGYKDIQTKSNRFFFADSGEALCVYSVDDGGIRTLIKHDFKRVKGSPRLINYHLRYSIIKRDTPSLLFVPFRDPATGRIGLVDDKMRILLYPKYESIDFDKPREGLTASYGNVSERYTLEQLDKDWEESGQVLDLQGFPKEILEEEKENEDSLTGESGA